MSVRDKSMSLEEAVAAHVRPGSHLSIGGFTLNRNPMAAVHEIIRQGIDGLHLYAHSNGQGLDELIGAGCVDRLDIAYAGNGRFAPTCICFARMIKENKIQVEDYTNFQMALRFLAGAMGVPFLPCRTSMGTDIMDNWGFDAGLRQDDASLPIHKLVTLANPFSRDDAADSVVLVPAITPDVTIIHAQAADRAGNTRIQGLTFCDTDQAKAARHLIVTCETLVGDGELNRESHLNQIPGFCVDAVVHLPFGAYPTACYGVYDYDPDFLMRYKKIARDADRFEAYVRDTIMGSSTHKDFMEKVCPNPGILAAEPALGYSRKVRRK